ncbi:MAG TPA: prolyl oligopeptidase family serine peptidase [Candidatus Deferrimicrobium sp.]|nr:prolyl oligopeptidase family serine peptidase [Candidatus Deferrimicrobium sp.]
MSIVGFAVWLLLMSTTVAQPASGPELPYQMPPKAIADLVDAPPTPIVFVGPDQQWLLILKYPPLTTLEDLSQPELRLAGLRINPRTNGPSRQTYYTEAVFKKLSDGKEHPLSGLPSKVRMTNIDWSPDGRWIAFTLTHSDLIELWVAEVKNGEAKKILPVAINDAYGDAFTWVSDSRTILARTVPVDRGAVPSAPVVPTGPNIQENTGSKAPARTYQDLLKNPYDAALLEYYATSQLVEVTLDGQRTAIGKPAVISQATPSPDGKYILVETVHRPFSNTVLMERFPKLIEVWDADGKPVYRVADLPLAENIPITFSSVRGGRRDVGWRADATATLCWAEALDGGDAAVETQERDRLYMISAPFDADPVPMITLGLRFEEIQWGTENLALVYESWWKTRQVRVWHVMPDSPEVEPKLIWDRSWEDRYNDPGRPLVQLSERGTYVLITADRGGTLFLSGEGASTDGDRPFLDEFDLSAKHANRLFRSEEPYYEQPVRLLDVEKKLLLTRRESVTEPPNYFVRDVKKGQQSQATFFPHPTPQLADVQKQLIRYKRSDGVDLTATLYLPPGYTPDDGPLPMLMWVYPQEYKSADAAGQITTSPYRFVRTGWWSPLLWLVHGYAVLDDPTMPIVGEGDTEPNDTYVQQLVAGAQAAVDEVVRRGVADRHRIAIGGHSYGAFTATNLLAHSDLFRAGIARSGAYNRTLTPFGFQSEERTLWEAPQVYSDMSPFMHADRINEPILLVHGEADNNSGTYPLQSERFYGALKGHGATARLVMLPHESHSYRARESVMHVLWETTEWLDKYVKNAPPREEPAGESLMTTDR